MGIGNFGFTEFFGSLSRGLGYCFWSGGGELVFGFGFIFCFFERDNRR